MPSVKPAVIGLKECVDALQAIGKVVTQSADRKGLYAGAVVVRDEARRRVPKRHRILERAIIARTKRVRNTGGPGNRYIGQVVIDKIKGVWTRSQSGKVILKRQRHQVGGGLTDVIYPRLYAHLVEYGTRPHSTRPLHKAPKPGHFYPPHPGSRPHPFLRPAEMSMRSRVFATYRQVVLAEIDKKARQLAAKNAARRR